MVHGDAHSRLFADIGEAEDRIGRYIATHERVWGVPQEHKLAGMIRELTELYERAGVTVYNRRYSMEDVDPDYSSG